MPLINFAHITHNTPYKPLSFNPKKMGILQERDDFPLDLEQFCSKTDAQGQKAMLPTQPCEMSIVSHQVHAQYCEEGSQAI